MSIKREEVNENKNKKRVQQCKNTGWTEKHKRVGI
jgi:hypothetical protein